MYSQKFPNLLDYWYKIRPFVDTKLMKTLYYSIVYSHLIYAIEVWGSADDTHLNKLLILQKRIVRLITFSDKRLLDYSFLPSDPLFFKLEIHKIHEIFKILVVKFIFKCLNETNPINFHSYGMF